MLLFALWVTKLQQHWGYLGRSAMPNRSRRAGSLIELLISLAIIGGLAGLILTAAMMLLKAAYKLGV